MHAVVTRSAFPSQNVKNTRGSRHFWRFRSRKSARRCGAKHILKSKCTKHTILGPLLEVEMLKKCTPLWREVRFQVKMDKTLHVRATFGCSDLEKVHAEKVHAVVARSTFRSQNVQNTGGSDHFWRFGCGKSVRRCGAKYISKSKWTKHYMFAPLLRFGCWKSARRCGAKHISKSKCTKHHMFAPLLEVRMLKKCAPLWREAHFQVKMYKTPHVRATFGGSDVASLHYTTLHYTTLHSTTLHYITLHYIPVHYITLHYTPVHSTTLNYTTPHYITLHYAQLHYTTRHYITLHYTTLHYTTLHYTTLSSTTLHYLTLHYTPLHYNYNYNYTPLHSTTLNYTTLHYTTLHYTTFHYTPLHYTTLHYTTLY